MAIRAAKEAKMKEKAKKRSSWFGGLGKKSNEDDDEIDEHEDFEEVRILTLHGFVMKDHLLCPVLILRRKMRRYTLYNLLVRNWTHIKGNTNNCFIV